MYTDGKEKEMYYEMEWREGDTDTHRRVFRAKDISSLWKAVNYMNMERKDGKRFPMTNISITELPEYSGEFAEITGFYVKDLLLDK